MIPSCTEEYFQEIKKLEFKTAGKESTVDELKHFEGKKYIDSENKLQYQIVYKEKSPVHVYDVVRVMGELQIIWRDSDSNHRFDDVVDTDDSDNGADGRWLANESDGAESPKEITKWRLWFLLQSFLQKTKHQLSQKQLLSSTQQEILRPNNLEMTQLARTNFCSRVTIETERSCFWAAQQASTVPVKVASIAYSAPSAHAAPDVASETKQQNMLEILKRYSNQLQVLMLSGIYFWWISWLKISLSDKNML